VDADDGLDRHAGLDAAGSVAAAAVGWRGLFWAVAGLLRAGDGADAVAGARDPAARCAGRRGRYREIVRHPLFLRLAPLAFFVYGGLIALQALWAGRG